MCLLTLFHNHYSKKFTTFDENSAVELTEDLLYLSSHFSLATFKILFVFAFQSLIIMCSEFYVPVFISIEM